MHIYIYIYEYIPIYNLESEFRNKSRIKFSKIFKSDAQLIK